MNYYKNLEDFLKNKDKDGVLSSNQDFVLDRTCTRFIYSGSWNPLTSSHLDISYYAKQTNKNNCLYFELSVSNVDKGDCSKILSLSDLPLDARINQFNTIGETVLVTKASTFIQKSHLFPRSTFIIGTDTLSRINDNKYYFGSEYQKLECINKIKLNRCKFLVFPRHPDSDSRKVDICDELKELCKFIEDYNLGYVPNDMSSTKIRESVKMCSQCGIEINKYDECGCEEPQ